MRFAAPLARGWIRARPNRFVMEVEMPDRSVQACYCPSTGDIGHLDFAQSRIPCLLSPTASPKAKMSQTVEALALDPSLAGAALDAVGDQQWFGINQQRANRVVEHFLRQGALLEGLQVDQDAAVRQVRPRKKRTKPGADAASADPRPGATAGGARAVLQREPRVGSSRFDFCVDSPAGPHMIEVKTPLHWFDTKAHPSFNHERMQRTTTIGDRLIRHFNALAQQAQNGPCSVIVLFMFDAEPYRPRTTTAANNNSARRREEVTSAVAAMRENGVKTWQLNVRVTPTEYALLDHSPLPDDVAGEA